MDSQLLANRLTRLAVSSLTISRRLLLILGVIVISWLLMGIIVSCVGYFAEYCVFVYITGIYLTAAFAARLPHFIEKQYQYCVDMPQQLVGLLAHPSNNYHLVPK